MVNNQMYVVKIFFRCNYMYTTNFDSIYFAKYVVYRDILYMVK